MSRSPVDRRLHRSFSLLPMLLALGCAGAPVAPAGPAEAPDFAGMLDQQAKDWNRGDLAAFCAVYVEDAAFVSPSGVKRGRAEILARYLAKYDTPEKRGQLDFELLEIRQQGAAASILLRWRIAKADSEASGHALIVLHRTEVGWRIVQDASM